LLFFDFTPFEQPLFDGYRIRFQIYTLQGAVANQAAWKMLLKGTDGLVLVEDASGDYLAGVRQDVVQLRGVLSSYGRGLDEVPLVLQLNKADHAGRVATAEAAMLLGVEEGDVHLTTATGGDGVLETLTALSRKVMARVGDHEDLSRGEQKTQGADHAPGDDVRPLPEPGEPEQPAAAAVVTPAPVEESRDSGQPDTAAPQIKVASDGVSMDGTTLRIPLEVAQPGGVQRLVVTVTVGLG
jgi:hypothetical protein